MKIEVYSEIVDVIADSLRSGKMTPKLRDNLTARMVRASLQLGLFGSAEVVKSFAAFKQLSSGGDKKTILAFVDVLTTMRKDLGLGASTPEDIFNLFVTE